MRKWPTVADGCRPSTSHWYAAVAFNRRDYSERFARIEVACALQPVLPATSLADSDDAASNLQFSIQIEVNMIPATFSERTTMTKAISRTALLVATAACAFAFCLGFTSQAHAYNVTVRLDNSSNPSGQVAEAGTSNTISVYVQFCGSVNYTPIGSRSLPTISSGHDFSWVATGATVKRNVNRIKVVTSGSDTFWIDQVLLLDDPNGVSWTSGPDDVVGVCISTDPTDGHDAICEPNGSFSSYVFDVPSPVCS